MRRAGHGICFLAALCVFPIDICNAQPAPNIVTNCQNAQQGVGESLFQVLGRVGNSGRPVTFDCPANTVITINPRSTAVIQGNTVIDGGGKVTLDGRGQPMTMFWISQGVGTLTLRNIRIKGARLIPWHHPIELFVTRRGPSSVIFSEEPLVLENVVIEDSENPIRTLKEVTIRNSRFSGNLGRVTVSTRGGAIVEKSQFTGNAGSGLSVEGRIAVSETQLIDNYNGIEMGAGSVKNSLLQKNRNFGILAAFEAGDISISGSTFDQNSNSGFFVGAPVASSLPVRVEIRRNVFKSNTSEQAAGAIHISGVIGGGYPTPPVWSPVHFELTYNRFVRNSGRLGAVGGDIGAVAANVTMNVKGGIFLENTARETGGAVHWTGHQLSVTNSLMKNNRAGASGAALYARNPRPATEWALTIANSLVVENVSGTGGAIDSDPASLLNVTIANHQGRGLVFAGESGQAMIANTILSRNIGGNCSGVAAAAFGRGNLQFGSSDCPGVLELDPYLDNFYVPALEGPAVAAGDGAICRAPPVGGVDMVFQPRVGGAQCTSGAFERPPVRIAQRKPKLVKTCPDGTMLPPRTPCPEQLKDCPGGQRVPVSTSCPEQFKTCPGGQVVPVETQCPEQILACLGGFMGLARDQAFQENIDRPGRDYANFDIELFTGGFGSAETTCRDKCENDPRCRAWTLVKAGVQGPMPRCWLKDSIPVAQGNTCCSSGVVMHELELGTNRPGKDYSVFDLQTPGSNACQAACQNDPRCAAWSYVAPQARCCLKDDVPAAHSTDCCTSGVTTRDPNVQ